MHSTSVVFAPSLQGGKQEAVLGLHDTWSTTQTHRPPPPLMVMIAAMLRSPHLDAVRLAVSRPAVNVQRIDGSLLKLMNEDRVHLLALVAAGDDDACSEAPLVPFRRPSGDAAWGIYQVYNSNAHTFLQCYCAALRTGNATALGTALQRVIKWYEPLRVFHPTYMNEAPFDLRPVSRHSFTPKAICDVLRCGDSQEARDHGTFLCVNEMARVLRQCRADRLSRQAPLRTMGDIRCLLAAHSFTDASVVVQRVVREFDLDDAIGALAELGHADMGSMVLAAVGDRPLPSSSTAFTHVYQETRAFEIRYIASRGLIIKTPLGEPSLMAAHDSNGDAIVHVAPPLDGARHHLLLHTPVATQPGTSAYRDRAAFHARWTAQLRGILDGWDWSHCVAAGGAVVRALVGRDSHDDALGDVDLFFYGLTYSQVRARLSALERHVEAKVGPGKYAVLLTSKTMTIITEYAPRLQVALGMWLSANDVLTNCDVDCCGAGYDGARVVLTGRAAMAYAYRVNVGTASSHRVRGSIVYETRLWKYAQRYGFAVLDPLHAPDSAAVVALRTQLGDLAKQGPVAAARHVATSLTGLRWLTAADLGLFTPTLTTALPNGAPLEEILQRVTAKGYVESDNYGTHEEGCVVVQPAAATDPFDTAFLDTEHYFDCYTPLTTATFANRCRLCDLDDFEVGDHVEMGVLEPRWNLLLTEDSAEEDA